MKIKNKVLKALAVTVAASTLFSAAACSMGGGTSDGTSNGGQTTGGTIRISLWESGWGREWLDTMATEFEKDNPEYKVKVDASASGGDITNLLPNPDQHDYDIIMGCNTDPSLYASYYELLDDVVNSKYKNESKTIGEKIGSELLSMLETSSGHYDKLCYGAGYYNIVYKTDIFEKYKYEVPKTTDQLVALVDKMRDVDEIVPFIHFTSGGYWHAMLWTWAIQYAGSESFYDMSENPTLAKLIDDENGIPQGLKVLGSILNNIKNYYTGSSGLEFSVAQSQFLAPAKKIGAEIAMMVNGGWMENELKNSEDELNDNVEVMKTPVVSSIIKKCDTINDDATLAAVIDAIDRNKTSYEGVSAEDFELIRTARGVEVTNAPGLEMCIPKYSDQKEGAKQFLRFFYSDKGLQIWFNKTHVKQFADFDDSSIQLDTSELSKFEKSQLVLSRKSVPVAEGRTHASHIIFVLGGASLTPGYDAPEYTAVMAQGSPETAEQVWTDIKANHNKNWKSYWSNAGLTAPQA